jgi:hypothetical protein
MVGMLVGGGPEVAVSPPLEVGAEVEVGGTTTVFVGLGGAEVEVDGALVGGALVG